MRVLIAVTHLLGAGHLTRAAALAGAFAGAGHAAVLVSGGAPSPLPRRGAARLVQLPPVGIAGTDFSRLRAPDGALADAALLDRRRAMLLTALDETAPDVVVTELFPFGRRALAAEFLALVEAARARHPRPLVVASVRDILVVPERPDRVAQAHARLAALYDAVLVHGDPKLVTLDASWPVDAGLARKIRYTGYVDGGGPVVPAGSRAGIVVASGSGAAGLGLLRAAAAAARIRPDLGWRIRVGHGVAEAECLGLGRGLPAGVVTRATPAYRALLAGAALSVSPCGYNTAVDLLATGTPALLVPFEAGRETEQRLRADVLHARGLARISTEAGLSADALLDAVTAALAAPGPGPHGIDLTGAARSVAIIADLAGRRDDARRPATPAREAASEADRAAPRAVAARGLRSTRGPAGLERLQGALDASADRGGGVSVWWRDDDAVAATPGLDRLLALAASHGAPILLAAIPALAEPSLARRLSAAEGASLAVHGLAHRNHAPPGAKPAEFGAHRPLATLRAEAARALDLAREAFPPARLLPVFVPPWNRIAPDLAAALPGLGYRGLSAAWGAAVCGLRRADATLDPIDWRGTRSLRDPGALIDELVATLSRNRPVGLLTHHRAHDEAVWGFLDALLPLLLRHPAVRMRDPRHLFAAGAVDAGAQRPSSDGLARARIG